MSPGAPFCTENLRQVCRGVLSSPSYLLPHDSHHQQSLRAQSSTNNQQQSTQQRPVVTSVANPPVQSGAVSYGPSYSMAYQPRSTADKSAMKYSGFLPLEGTHKDDECRIG